MYLFHYLATASEIRDSVLIYAALYRALGNNIKELESFEYEGKKADELRKRIRSAHVSEEHQALLKVGCYI